jgi:Condensation domain
VIHPAGRFELPLIDVSGDPDPERRAQEVMEEMASAPFDLSEGPALRLRLARAAPEEHHLLRVEHHIITDAWSWRIFFDELRVLYEGFQRGETDPLPGELPFQPADYAALERKLLEPSSPHFQREISWWREALRDAPTRTPALPFERAEPKPDAHRSEGLIYWGLPPEVSRGLDRLGQEAGATYYMVRLAVLVSQLVTETGVHDLVLGTYSDGRRLPETQAMFGWFGNLVTLRFQLEPDLPFRQVLERVRASVLEVSPHMDFPYEALAGRLREEGVEPPEIQFIYNPGGQRPARIHGLELTHVKHDMPFMPWEVTFAPTRGAEATDCLVGLDARKHDPEAVQEFLERYKSLAAEVCSDPDRRIESLVPSP